MRPASRLSLAALAAAALSAVALGAAAPAGAATPAPPVTCGTTPPTPMVLPGLLTPSVVRVSPDSTELPTATVTNTPPGTTGVSVAAVCAADPALTVSFPLDGHGSDYTAVVPSNMALLRNGYYTFKATVSYKLADLPLSSSAQTSILLDAPPQPPQGLVATAASDGHSVLLAWAGNKEPDLSGYVVERTDGSGKDVYFRSTTTSYRDTTTSPGGRYTYGVFATRPDIHPGKPALTSIVSNQPVVPTPSSPATAGSGGGGGSTGGIFGSFGGSAFGSAGGAGAGGAGITGSFSKPSPGPSQPATGAPSLGGFQNTLPYPSTSQGVGNQREAGRAASAKETGSGTPIWAIALAFLLLAMAGGAFTLRRRLSREPALETVPPQRGPGARGS